MHDGGVHALLWVPRFKSCYLYLKAVCIKGQEKCNSLKKLMTVTSLETRDPSYFLKEKLIQFVVVRMHVFLSNRNFYPSWGHFYEQLNSLIQRYTTS